MGEAQKKILQIGIIILTLGSILGLSIYLIETGKPYWGRGLLLCAATCFAWVGVVRTIKLGRVSGDFWTAERKENRIQFWYDVIRKVIVALIFTAFFVWVMLDFNC